MEPPRLKILVVAHAMRIGGIERALIGLLEAKRDEGHEVSLFLWAHEGDFMGLLPQGIHLLPEMPAYAALERPITTIIWQGQWGIALARLVAKTVTGLRRRLGIPGFTLCRSVRYTLPFLPKIPGTYDQVLSFAMPHDVAAWRVVARDRRGWIHTDPESVEDGVDRALEGPMWAAMDRLYGVSCSVRSSFARVFPGLAPRIEVMENLLSPATIRREADADLGEDMPQETGVWRLCSVGRYTHAKNFDSVPIIARHLEALGCDFRWYLIGYGPDEGLIRSRIKEMGMEQRVILLGKRTNPYPYMKNCDLYVQPSRYEGKAITVREAQVLGVPVVITAFPTAEHQLSEDSPGWIVPIEPLECAKALHGLLALPSRQGDPAIRVDVSG